MNLDIFSKCNGIYTPVHATEFAMNVQMLAELMWLKFSISGKISGKIISIWMYSRQNITLSANMIANHQ